MKNIAFHFFTMFSFFAMEYGVTAVAPVYIATVLSPSGHLAGYFVGIFSFAALVSKIFSGYLSDIFNRKAVFVFGIVLTSISVLFYPLASLFVLMLAVRGFQGFGSGFVRAVYSPVTIEIAHDKTLAKTIGIIGAAALLAMMWASPLAIFVYEKKGFGFTMRVIALLGLAALIFAMLVRHKKTKISIKEQGIKSFIEPSVIHISLLKGWTGAGYGIFLAFGIIYAKSFGGFNAGLVITFYAISNLFLRLFFGVLVDKVGVNIWAAVAYPLMAAGYLLFSVKAGAFSFLAGAALIGSGIGVEYTIILYMLGSSVKSERINAAGATLEIFFSIGLALGAIGAAALKDFLSVRGYFITAGLWQIAPLLFFIFYALPKYKKLRAHS